RMMSMYFAMVSSPLSGRPWMTFSPGGRTAWAEIDTAGQLVQPDVPDLPVAQLESEVGAGGLAPPVRGRPGVQQAQALVGGVPGDVAVPEDQEAQLRVCRTHPLLATLLRAGLVDHPDAEPLELGRGHLGQPAPQLRAVVVAVAGQQRGGALLQLVEEVGADPVTRVDDEVGSRHLRP